MLFALTALIVSLVAGPAADVTGKWDGTLKAQRPDGTPMEDTVLLILAQKDNALSGSVGEADHDQHPIVSGTVDGNKVTILVKNVNNGREYKLDLVVDGDEMKGQISYGERTGTLAVKKRKP